jgi:hypothetical protein
VLTVEGKWGFINAQGNFVIHPKYNQAESFVNGEALVKSGGKFIFINTSGKKTRNVENPEEQEERSAARKLDSTNQYH